MPFIVLGFIIDNIQQRKYSTNNLTNNNLTNNNLNKMKWINFLIKTGDMVAQKVSEIYRNPETFEIVGNGAGGDETKRIDRFAEDLIISSLKGIDENVCLISEEIGEKNIYASRATSKTSKNSRKFLFVDPIDGSNNAALGIPFFCISLAVSSSRHLKDIEAAYVKNIFGDCFYAVKGGGAFYEGLQQEKRKINVSMDDEIKFLGLSLGKHAPEIGELSKVLKHTEHMRSLGSIALSLCYVAYGSLNAYVDFRPARILDITAAKLIVEESGGVVDLIPEKHNQNQNIEELEVNVKTTANIIAGNRKIVEKIKKII